MADLSEVNENCTLLGCHAASNGSFLPKFRDNLSVPSCGFKNLGVQEFFNPEDGTDSLSRNVGKKLALLVA